MEILLKGIQEVILKPEVAVKGLVDENKLNNY